MNKMLRLPCFCVNRAAQDRVRYVHDDNPLPLLFLRSTFANWRTALAEHIRVVLLVGSSP